MKIVKLIYYWALVVLCCALMISCFSCFFPYENLKSFFIYGFFMSSLVYFKLTFFFYLTLSGILAFPCFLLNFLFIQRKNKNNIFRNVLITNISLCSLFLFVYYYLAITNDKDFFLFIVPTYFMAIVGFYFLLFKNSRDLEPNITVPLK